MKTILESLVNIYDELKSSTEPNVCVARRDLYLMLEDIKDKLKQPEEPKIEYFYNEKGDYTITLRDEPLAVAYTEENALKIINHVNGLTMRVDVLSKIKTLTLT